MLYLAVVCSTGGNRSATPPSTPPHTPSSFHPHLVSERDKTVMTTKAHLVLRMIQQKIGHELFLQVSQTLYSLAQVHCS